MNAEKKYTNNVIVLVCMHDRDNNAELLELVLRHRVVVAPELELEGVSADTVLKSLLEKIEAPA